MANTKKAAPKLNKSQNEALEALDTTAAKIRYLTAEGHERGDIARILGIRYQWVRNVQLQPIKKG